MKKSELIQYVSGATDIPPEAVGKVMNTALDMIITAVSNGDTVSLPGFGHFSRKHREARIGRNPRTGERIDIPACKVPHFQPGKVFRETVKTGG